MVIKSLTMSSNFLKTNRLNKMKNNYILILLSFFSVTLLAQEKALNEITSFKIKNSGFFIDKNNDVDGYYFYYEVDKLKKGKREYAINMLDNNLNEIASKSYIGDKKDMLIESKFNNQSLMFAILNLDKKYYKLVTFNKQGEQGKDIIIPISKMDARLLEFTLKSDLFKPLFSVDNKGFIFQQTVLKNRTTASKLKYIPTDGGKSWVYNQVLEKNIAKGIKIIEANEKVIVLYEVVSQMSKKEADFSAKVIVLDVNTGETLFEKEYDANNYRLVSNAFLTEDKTLVLLGEYYEDNGTFFKNSSLGLFSEVLDFNGEVISDKKIGWDSGINEMLGVKKKGNDEYIYFHDIIRTQKGTYYAMAEKYHKTRNNKGEVVNSITSTDAMVFAFDGVFELKDIKVFEKGESTSTEMSILDKPQMYARLFKALGGFDYEFTQIDENRDRFYATYINYNTLKKEDKKILLKTIIYNEGELSEDEIRINNTEEKGVSSRVLPGKLGYVMLLEYNKDEKALNMHLEKLNIE